MKDWSSRPFEERNLFNPAFCAVVLAAAIREYERVSGKPIPYSLTLLVLPMCLHLASREQILENKKLSVLRVFALRPDLLVGLRLSGRERWFSTPQRLSHCSQEKTASRSAMTAASASSPGVCHPSR